MSQPFVFVVATVGDLSAADAIVDDLTPHSPFGVHRDVVSVGRKQSGDVRFHREGGAASIERTWNAAAGLAAALFPSVGADHPSRGAADRTVLAAVSGRVAAAVGRQGLRELGEVLDTASAAVIVVTAADHGDEVMELLLDAVRVRARTGRLDVDALDRLVQTTMMSRPTRDPSG